MIDVRFVSLDLEGDEVSIGLGVMPHAPRIGETIWLLGNGSSDLTAYRVTDVCYWVPDLSTATSTVQCGSCAAFVEPAEGDTPKGSRGL